MVQQEKERYLAGASSDGTKSRGDDDIDPSSSSSSSSSIEGVDGMSSSTMDMPTAMAINNMDAMLDEGSAGGGSGSIISSTAVSADIVQMDSIIQEKEEILSKLLDTVKGKYI